MVRRDLLGLLILYPILILIFAIPTQWILNEYFQSIYAPISGSYYLLIGMVIFLTEVYVLLAEYGRAA